MPVLATYFSVRRGRDPFFKFFMRTIFPRQVREYEQKFGHTFILFANGRSAEDMLAALRARLGNEPDVERAITADELRKITLSRLEKLLAEAR